MTIEFYRIRGETYGAFSNFYVRGIRARGRVWQSTEHYYQAAKFFRTDPAWAEAIYNAPTPRIAANMGRDRAHPIDPDWELGLKDDAMRRACLAKFTQHADLRELLLGTGDEHLVEASPIDPYWGYGADRKGKNMLGIVLMEIRTVLRDQNQSSFDLHEWGSPLRNYVESWKFQESA